MMYNSKMGVCLNMKTRIAVIIPIIIFVLSLSAILVAEWQRGSFDHRYDIHVLVDEVAVQENGDVQITAHGIFNDPKLYKLTVPQKLADKYFLDEGMSLSCDIKEKDGLTIVTKIDNLYKK